MPIAARILLETAAALIAAGGAFDLLVPRLPRNLSAMCGENEQARKLARELLRALGGALVAIGVAMFMLVATSGAQGQPVTLVLILILVLPAEGINAFCMYRVGSPFYIPLTFVLLTVAGVGLAWVGVTL
jgi:hypothetical protein